ncbi:DUF4164 family protein [Methylocella sp.]|uniref:DUF4164 family protein n=1 Tax=Methylocella sp. TaxID=1978226 RepID=UPI0037837510
MDESLRFDDALGRLSAALERLAAASARRLKADGRRGDLEEELAVLQDDRSRLAVELDAALARAASVEAAAEDVVRKVKSAGAAIREIVAAADAQDA